ncbi:DUF427 domain-containing protein [Polymorphobacter fuscus]|uniref:DUF427 domain-containing protein n=1 Tax=Sandarakinorhabdus fusca TaxID=1439888 RepID=A0A7C9KYB5_9SPHN|nr:DUF427 domain-containing protein [Polymorphobacter fuscus]KAB7647508.1 DUF427 domain-containing protein [Polymorphobacter fuscus]MQT16768.1 DUF427 domain-containing protein [Polymorphobacter fuscus]NJC09244.1 uncharacterized protein (DUF427 family) [Polymorphobacter fuscus]
MTPVPDPVAPGQESVWDYPRPPRLEPTSRRIRIVHAGAVVADSVRALRLLETSHPPGYYIPPADIDMALLRPGRGSSFCEWKGNAVYWDVIAGGTPLLAVGWSYPTPVAAYAALRDHIAFYAGPFDGCFVDDEQARPQPDGFYGGWITADVAGPFKGIEGSRFW